MRRRRGFTLIEIAIVVALMGIIGGYAAPRLVEARVRASSRSATQGIIAQVTRARTIASRRRISTRVILSSSTIRALGTVGGVEQEILPPLNVTSDFGVSLTSSRGEVRFDSRGFASGLTGAVEVMTYHGSVSSAVCISRYGNARAGRCL